MIHSARRRTPREVKVHRVHLFSDHVSIELGGMSNMVLSPDTQVQIRVRKPR